MTLSCLELGQTGIISSCSASGAVLRRLENLGFLEGTPVRVLSRTNGGLIVNVRGTRLALSIDAANTLQIKE